MAIDIFLKLDGINGDSTDSNHQGEIDVLSYSLGSSNFVSLSSRVGGGAGKVTFQDIHLTMSASSASPLMMLACASGKHIATAVLTARKSGTSGSGEVDFLKITLTDCFVSSYETGGATTQDIPVDQISLNFTKIETDYQPQSPDGKLGTLVSGIFDLAQNAVVPPPATIG